MNDENIIKYRKLEDLEFMEIDLRRQIGETNELVKQLEKELKHVTKEKNTLKTELENIPYFPRMEIINETGIQY